MLRSIPVCMFHHVNENAGDFITVSVDRFESMMGMLHEEGYSTLTSDAFRLAMLGMEKAPTKPVLLTFDDAWLDVFVHAFPILKHYGHKFTVFVVSDRTALATRSLREVLPGTFPLHSEAAGLLDSPRIAEVVCGWQDLQVMLESGLCSVENHTASHGRDPDVRGDMERGRQAIREALGVPANQLCWPRGKYDARLLALAKELGMDMTYLVRRGVNLPRLWTMKIKRFTVEDRSAQWFKHQLEIFSRPIYGYLYSRIKPDRLKAKYLPPVKR